MPEFASKAQHKPFPVDSVQANLPPAASGYDVKRWVGVNVVCAERKDTPQWKDCNPASEYFCCVVLLSKRYFRFAGLAMVLKNSAKTLKFLFSSRTSGKKIKALLKTKIYRFFKRKMHVTMWIFLGSVRGKRRGKLKIVPKKKTTNKDKQSFVIYFAKHWFCSLSFSLSGNKNCKFN